MALPVFVPRATGVVATLWPLFADAALAITTADVEVPTPVATLGGIPLIVLVITGLSMLIRPWVQRFRARKIDHHKFGKVDEVSGSLSSHPWAAVCKEQPMKQVIRIYRLLPLHGEA